MNTTEALNQFISQGFNKKAWHGSNLLTSIRKVTEEEASWRPQPERHNIWELAIHADYWKYRVYTALTEEPPRKFEAKGSNWFVRPAKDNSESWEADKILLKTWHDRLLFAVENFDTKKLNEEHGNSGNTYYALISGAAMHDVYHAGQIKLIRKLKEAE